MAAKKGSDLHYHTPMLTRWFAISSVLLAVLTVWLILADHRRPWKQYQEGFRAYDLERTEALKAEAESEIPAQDLQNAQAALEAGQAQLAQQAAGHEAAEAALRHQEDQLRRVDQAWRNAKAYQATLRYQFELAQTENNHDLEEKRSEYHYWNDEVDRLTNELKVATAERDRAQEAVDAFTAEIDAAETSIASLEKKVSRIENKLESLRPNFPTEYVLNEPVLDIMAPTLKIRQVVVNDIEQDINYTSVPRVDRCMTCHMAIDQAGYDDAPPPWNGHPQLDLYAGSSSPHPMEEFGCSTCHFGRDRSLDFTRVNHAPNNHEQEEEWREKYGWEEPHLWNFPMLPTDYIDSTCFKCHMDQDRVPGSKKAAQAEDAFQVFGCFGCHKAKGYENLRKVGPTLRRYAAKVPNRQWTYRWLEAPRAFRSKTRMPHFWNLLNNSAQEDVPYNHAEIRGITEYIYDHSESMTLPRLPGRGDPTNGEDLVSNLGCLGCHVTGTRPEDESLSRLHPRRFGPSLAGIGSKAVPEWIYRWVKNPKDYWPETRMPDLRLSDQEALDITAYLVSLKKDAFLGTPFLETEVRPRDELLIEFFRNTMTAEQAGEKVASMGDHEKWVFLGERSIAKYGCYGCHDLPGFEDANPIGVELSEEGSKEVHLFDFGQIHVPHTRHDWISQKLRAPRIWDEGRVKSRSERLKMPNFGFSDEEARIATTAVLSFTKDKVSAEMRKTLSARETALEAGRSLVRERNCRGCHELEEEGRAIEQALVRVFQDQGMSEQEATTQADAFAPPLITIEGSKVRPDWLYRFFKQPSTIRTWLRVRMPSFHFTDEEINTLITYFNTLSEQTYPFKTYPDMRMTRQENEAATRLASQEYLACFKCHAQGAGGTITGTGSAAEWAPNLSLANGRLKPDWIENWLREPNAIQPGTRMPTYFDPRFFDQTGPPDILDGDEDAQIQALVKYVLSLGSPSSSRSSGAAGRQ